MSIYMIKSKEPSLHDFYIGSCDDMRDRMYKHKSRCNNENNPAYNQKKYKFIRANGGWDAWQMVEIGCVWKKATKPLFEIEQDYMDMWCPTLNSNRASTGKPRKEYMKEYLKEYKKKYYNKNKDIINEKYTCECGGKYTQNNKSKHINTKKHKSFIENE